MDRGKLVVPKDAIEVPEDAVEVLPPPEAPGIPPTRPASKLRTAALSGIQGAGYGLLDEATGAIGAGAELLGLRNDVARDTKQNYGPAPWLKPGDANYEGSGVVEDVGAQMDKRAGVSPVRRAYVDERDAARREIRKAEADNPKTALLARLAGALVAPGPKVAKGSTGMGLVGQGAKVGALTGAGYGFGESEADNLGDVAKDTLRGGAVGGGTGAAMGGLNALLQRYLAGAASRRAYKALDPHQKSINALMDRSPVGEPMLEADRLGRKALDEGLVRPFDNSSKIAQRAAVATEETGQMLGGTVQRIQDDLERSPAPLQSDIGPALPHGKPVRMGELADRLESEAALAKQSPGTMDLARAMEAEAQSARDAAQNRVAAGKDAFLTLPQSEKEKTLLQGRVDYDKTRTMTQPTVDAKKAAAAIQRKLTEDAVEGVAGPEELAQFKALKNRYGDLVGVRDTAAYGAGRAARNNWLSLGDQQLAQAGAAAGGKWAAVAAALLNKLGRERGSSAAANAFDALSKGGAIAPASRAMSSVDPDAQKRLELLSRLRDYLGD